MKTLLLILMLCGSILAQNDAADTSGKEKGILEEDYKDE